MARRRRQLGILEDFFSLPWQYSVIFGVIAYIALRWIIPALFAKNVFLVALSATFRSLAWIPLVLFGFAGFFSYAMGKEVKTAKPSKPADVPVGTWSAPRPSPHSASVQTGAATDMQGFGHSAGVVTEWTIEGIRKLEWKRFELLCAGYYDAMGFKTQTLRCGADGGIDVKLFKADMESPIAVVQCKAWNSGAIGVKEIRELLGVMAHEKVRRGIFITTSAFTKDASSFAAANPIQLIDGEAFVSKIRQLPEVGQAALLKAAFDGDYRTPTCASCGVKMVRRQTKARAFWGCPRYPKCRTVLHANA